MNPGASYWTRPIGRYSTASVIGAGSAPAPDLIERIDDDLREILETHRPAPMSPVMQKEIREILGRFDSD